MWLTGAVGYSIVKRVLYGGGGARTRSDLQEDGEESAPLAIQAVPEGDDLRRQTSTASCTFVLCEQDQEELRWYFEDHLQYPFDPAPIIVNRIEGRINEIGEKLFDSIFRANEDTLKLWEELAGRLNSTRIEVVMQIRETAIHPLRVALRTQDRHAFSPAMPVLCGRRYERQLLPGAQPAIPE